MKNSIPALKFEKLQNKFILAMAVHNKTTSPVFQYGSLFLNPSRCPQLKILLICDAAFKQLPKVHSMLVKNINATKQIDTIVSSDLRQTSKAFRVTRC